MFKKDVQQADSEIAYAKINLALHVRARLPSGYHQIETIFAFLDRGDKISVEKARGLHLAITGPFSNSLSNSDNLVMDAAKMLGRHRSTAIGANITLEKNLPISSGIGGGSADAAAALRLLNRFWNINMPVRELAELSAPLGADVPACVLSQTSRGEGIGQTLKPLINGTLQDSHVLLVNPQREVSTAAIFENWDGIDRGPLGEGPLREIIMNSRNDLEVPAVNLLPIIQEILTILSATESIHLHMSGSGATCFALYENREQSDAARETISRMLPNMWTMAGQLR